jgi:hypothetical protein
LLSTAALTLATLALSAGLSGNTALATLAALAILTRCRLGRALLTRDAPLGPITRLPGTRHRTHGARQSIAHRTGKTAAAAGYGLGTARLSAATADLARGLLTGRALRRALSCLTTTRLLPAAGSTRGALTALLVSLRTALAGRSLFGPLLTTGAATALLALGGLLLALLPLLALLTLLAARGLLLALGAARLPLLSLVACLTTLLSLFVAGSLLLPLITAGGLLLTFRS